MRARFVTTLVAATIIGMTTVTASAATFGSGDSVAAAERGRPVSSDVASLATQAAASAYWTPARMARARTVPRDAPSAVERMSGRRVVAVGKPRQVDGIGTNLGDPILPTSGVTPAGYDYPFPYTRRAVETPLYALAPYRAIGKLFMRQNGIDYVCSAESVTGGSRNIVFTAGHCANDGAGRWSTRIVFVPGYHNGARPHGSFPASQVWAMNGWVDGGDWTYDQAAFSVGKNASGKTLRSQVGALGFAWDWPRDSHWDLFGYPQGAPFSGATLQVCEASHAVDEYSGLGQPTMGVGCDMTGGSSGGPWILGLGRGSYLNGLNSYGYVDEGQAMYGPYFDDFTNGLRCAAGTGQSTATSC